MKKNLISLGILLGYSVPYVFLAMLGDAEFGTPWLYVLWLISLAVLSLLSRSLLTLLAGNALSFLSSHAFMAHFQTDKWTWCFKPFSAPGLLTALTLAALLAQILYYLRRRKAASSKQSHE